jgi:hypothetical protein
MCLNFHAIITRSKVNVDAQHPSMLEKLEKVHLYMTQV